MVMKRRRHDDETVWPRLRDTGKSRETVVRSASLWEGQQVCGKVSKSVGRSAKFLANRKTSFCTTCKSYFWPNVNGIITTN